MTRFDVAIVDRLLRALDPSEREVVAGDLCELGLSGPRAVGEVLGLVIRRRVAAWREPRAWLALALVALPLAMLLSLLSRHWANSAAVAVWFYVDNWTPAYLDSPAARGDLVDAIAMRLTQCAALVAWAWTIGYALALLSRRTAWLTFIGFAVVLFAATAGTTTIAARNPSNSAVFSLPLYRVAFPFVFRIVFVILPALAGIRRGTREPGLALARIVAVAAVVVVLTALLRNGPYGALVFGWWSLSADRPVLPMSSPREAWPLHLLPLAMLLPALYVVSHSVRKSRRRSERSELA